MVRLALLQCVLLAATATAVVTNTTNPTNTTNSVDADCECEGQPSSPADHSHSHSQSHTHTRTCDGQTRTVTVTEPRSDEKTTTLYVTVPRSTDFRTTTTTVTEPRSDEKTTTLYVTVPRSTDFRTTTTTVTEPRSDEKTTTLFTTVPRSTDFRTTTTTVTKATTIGQATVTVFGNASATTITLSGTGSTTTVTLTGNASVTTVTTTATSSASTITLPATTVTVTNNASATCTGPISMNTTSPTGPPACSLTSGTGTCGLAADYNSGPKPQLFAGPASSLTACALLCEGEPGCVSLLYNSASTTASCVLFSSNVGGLTTTPDPASSSIFYDFTCFSCSGSKPSIPPSDHGCTASIQPPAGTTCGGNFLFGGIPLYALTPLQGNTAATLGACYQQCLANSQCLSNTFDGANCVLYSASVLTLELNGVIFPVNPGVAGAQQYYDLGCFVCPITACFSPTVTRRDLTRRDLSRREVTISRREFEVDRQMRSVVERERALLKLSDS